MKNSNRILEKIKNNKGLFKIFGSGVLTKIIAFLSNIILIRFVTKEAYGMFSYVTNIYSIIIILSGFGILPTTLQLASENYNNKNVKDSIYFYGFVRGLLSNVVLCLVILVLYFVYPFEIVGSKYLFIMYILMPLFEYVFQYLIIYYRGERNEDAYFVVNVSFQFLCLVFSIIGTLLFDEKGFIIGHYLSYLFSIIIGFKINRNKIIADNNLTSELRKDFFKISFSNLIGNAFYQLKSPLTIYILGIYIPSASILAEYNVASKIPNALFFIPLTLVTYIYPYFAEHINDKKWVRNSFKKILLYNGLFNLLIAIGFIVFSKIVLSIAFGYEYIESINIFRLLMINYFIVSTFVTIPGNLLITQRKHVFNLIVNIFGTILSIVFSIIMINTNGSMGAAYSEIIISIIFAIVYLSYFYYCLTKDDN